jgi:hypothetical protein
MKKLLPYILVVTVKPKRQHWPMAYFVLPVLVSILVATGSAFAQGRYVERADYLQAAFPGDPPAANTLWVTKELRQNAEDSLGFGIGSLRVRYWHRDSRSAWVLDEIGKERPITIGIVVENNVATMVRVLEFRESRGWEVRYPFFTDQFDAVSLDSKDRLDRSVDSITGATLSVDAVTRAVRLALFLSRYTGDVNS